MLGDDYGEGRVMRLLDVSCALRSVFTRRLPLIHSKRDPIRTVVPYILRTFQIDRLLASRDGNKALVFSIRLKRRAQNRRSLVCPFPFKISLEIIIYISKRIRFIITAHA